MDLLKTLMNAAGSGDLQKLGQQFGLDGNDVNRVLQQVVPALGQGIQKNTAASGGLESLLGALQKGNHKKYIEDVGAAVSSAGISEGNGILGHVFGSKDVSRKVAAHAASESGVSADIIKQMLPMVATMAMGALSKESAGGQKPSALASLLDRDGDGSAMDDVMNFAKKFF